MINLGQESQKGYNKTPEPPRSMGLARFELVPTWRSPQDWLELPYGTSTFTLPNSLAPTEGLASSGLVATSTGRVQRPSLFGESIPEETYPEPLTIFSVTPVGIQAIRRLELWPSLFPALQVEERRKSLAARSVSFGGNVVAHVIREAITQAAENYARGHGLYGSLILTKGIIREKIPLLRSLHIDLKRDPDAGGYPTICFTVTTREVVDRILEADRILRDAMFDRIPDTDRMYLSLDYQFE